MVNNILELLSTNRLNCDEQEYVKNAYFSYDSDLTQKMTDDEDFKTKYKFLEHLNVDKDNRKIEYDYCATNLIKKIFDLHLGKKTLVIINPSQHPNVEQILNNYKYTYEICNMHELCYGNKDDIFAKLKTKLNSDVFSNVIVYFIGTVCGDGYQFDQNFIDTVISICKQHYDTTAVLDAVQELFLVERDYQIFDYIIGTAHALVPNYNLGILISKSNAIVSTGFKPINSIRFANIIDMIAARKRFINNFNALMKNEFFNLYGKQIYKGLGFTYTFNNSSNGIFSLKCRENDKIVFYDFSKRRPAIQDNQVTIVDINENFKPLIIRGPYCLFDELLHKNNISYIQDVQQIFNLLKKI